MGDWECYYDSQRETPDWEDSDSSQRESPDSEDSDSSQGEVPDWCYCGECEYMEAQAENICCRQHNRMLKNMSDYDVDCITSHPAFQTVVLDPFVLETAYYSYRMTKYRRGKLSTGELTNYRLFRYTAYRQPTRWCWGMLGKNIRKELPACAITAIRNTFPFGFSHL
ncbi:uncharacterized protein LOC144769543 [Lissotriton helveticus]